MSTELEKITSETQLLYGQFSNDRRALSRRRSELVEQFKSQVSTWELTRPHSDELESGFLEQRKAIVSINDEFTDWTRRYNAGQRQLQAQLTSPSESDLSTKISDVRKLRGELLRNCGDPS
jgi:uncharacterized coiled-coil DUF342 family protein